MGMPGPPPKSPSAASPSLTPEISVPVYVAKLSKQRGNPADPATRHPPPQCDPDREAHQASREEPPPNPDGHEARPSAGQLHDAGGNRPHPATAVAGCRPAILGLCVVVRRPTAEPVPDPRNGNDRPPLRVDRLAVDRLDRCGAAEPLSQRLQKRWSAMLTSLLCFMRVMRAKPRESHQRGRLEPVAPGRNIWPSPPFCKPGHHRRLYHLGAGPLRPERAGY